MTDNVLGSADTRASPVRVVSGFGRSGTTWVQDVVAETNSLRAVFEPLRPEEFRSTQSFAHIYLGENDDCQSLYQHLEGCFRGEISSIWTDYRIEKSSLWLSADDFRRWSAIKKKLRSHRSALSNYAKYRRQRQYDDCLVKFVRANMMLSWLKKNFEVKIVHVVRHPVAVVLSQLRNIQVWNPDRYIGRYRRDTRLLAVLGDGAKYLLDKNLDDVEALTLCWCIENSIAQKQCEFSNIPIIYYEHLVENGKSEWQKVLSALDLDVMPSIDMIEQPSQQTWNNRGQNASLLRRYDSWMDAIDSGTRERIQTVLDATGISFYHTRSALPK